MIDIGNDTLRLALHEPLDGFYRGTRFDRSGVFDGVLYRGVQMAGRWFTRYDPFMHDAVCGPAEEFTAIGFDAAAPGGTFLKIGVGLLTRPDDAPYDRFRLYQIAQEGEWTVESTADRVLFRHRLPGWYDYLKEVALTGPSSFEIRHVLEGAEAAVEVYNHNFWTLGKFVTGPSRQVDLPFQPAGNWRAEYDSVGLTPSGIRFSRPLAPGESVYMGNLHAAPATSVTPGAPCVPEGMPYRMVLREDALGVEITGDAPVTHTVFWANHRVACLEPYNTLTPPCRWTLRYRFL